MLKVKLRAYVCVCDMCLCTHIWLNYFPSLITFLRKSCTFSLLIYKKDHTNNSDFSFESIIRVIPTVIFDFQSLYYFSTLQSNSACFPPTHKTFFLIFWSTFIWQGDASFWSFVFHHIMMACHSCDKGFKMNGVKEKGQIKCTARVWHDTIHQMKEQNLFSL